MGKLIISVVGWASAESQLAESEPKVDLTTEMKIMEILKVGLGETRFKHTVDLSVVRLRVVWPDSAWLDLVLACFSAAHVNVLRLYKLNRFLVWNTNSCS